MLAAMPAAAEICDKARPAWDFRNGPVSQVDDLLLFLVEPIGVLTLLLTIVALALGKRWLAMTVSIILGLLIAVFVDDWFSRDDPVIAAVYAEGCRAPPILISLALAALILLIILRAFMAHRSRN